MPHQAKPIPRARLGQMATYAQALAKVDAARPAVDSLFAIIDDLVAQIELQARRNGPDALHTLVLHGGVALWRAQRRLGAAPETNQSKQETP